MWSALRCRGHRMRCASGARSCRGWRRGSKAGLAVLDETQETRTVAGSTVVLGVTGSIAAYKAAELTSRLVQAGHDVHVIMTRSATELVQPRTFLTLSRNPVITDLWTLSAWQPGHIALAERAHLLVVAPATANIIGKLAHGIADDALSTYALSHAGPTLVAPAMNPRMWAQPAVQENCETLRQRGAIIVAPETGRVACGTAGAGRLAGTERILQAIQVHLAASALRLDGVRRPRLLVTAGPTREALDPVRFLSNRSSGKMGYAVAAVAAAAGLETTLISGPCALPTPPLCRRVDVTSAADMLAAVTAAFPSCDVLVMCAAVADFQPAAAAPQKIKKHAAAGGLSIDLVPTRDILASVKDLRQPGQRIMGFAAETEDAVAQAGLKLRAKGLDWIVANDVSRTDTGFDSDLNEATVISAAGVQPFPAMPKIELAARLLELILKTWQPQAQTSG